MKINRKITIKLLLVFILLITSFIVYSEIKDIRYCGLIKRDFNGEISRDQNVLRDFQFLYPCPSTGKKTGACPGWSKDHIIPLACGGCDSIENLQWLPVEIKSCSGSYCKDRFERKVYSVYQKSQHCK